MGFRIEWFAIAILFFTACGDTQSSDIDGDCSVDSECPTGQICRLGICGVQAAKPRAIGFTLTPPADASLPVQTIRPASIRIDKPIQLLLNRGARVSGKISFIGSTISPSGTLTFTDESSEFTTQTTAQRGEYSVVVPVGNYRLTFVPEDPSIPSKVWKNIRFERDSDPKLTLPAPEYTLVSGTLSFVDKRSVESKTVTGARVFAVSKETGSLSTIATTNADGSFEIRVLPDSGNYDLRVTATIENEFVPDTTFPDFFISTDKGWTSKTGEDIATLSVALGEYTTADSSTQIQLTSEAKIDSWEEFDVLVTFSAGQGEIRLRPSVLPDGTFSVPKLDLPGSFNIIAPPQSPISSYTTTRLLSETSPISCATKFILKGQVLSAAGNPVVSRLEAVPTKDGALRIVATTDEDGFFEIGLEPFEYLITAIPQNGAIARSIIKVDGKSDEPESRIITIPEPTLVWGTVFIQSGDALEALGDVTIQAFEIRDGERLKVGEARSDTDGGFKLIVPNEN